MGANCKQMEALLYYKFKLVGLKPTDRVNLLDLLVRVRGGTFGGKRILNLGCFLLYNRSCPDAAVADDDSDAEDSYSSYQEEIKEGLKALEAREYDDLEEDGIFKVHEDRIEHTERISTATGLSAKLLQVFTGWCKTAAEMQCTISNLWYHAVVDSAIHHLFVGDKGAGRAPLWKPDMRKISDACYPKGGGGGSSLEIWIVREKDFCEDISFYEDHETSANASFAVDGTSQAVTAQASRQTAVTRHTLGFHQLGFKAVRLFYNEDGDLLKWRPYMGDSVPTLRHHDVDNPSCHDQFQDYHMGAFFEDEPPPTHGTKPDVANLSLELLDIHTLTTAS